MFENRVLMSFQKEKRCNKRFVMDSCAIFVILILVGSAITFGLLYMQCHNAAGIKITSFSVFSPKTWWVFRRDRDSVATETVNC